MPEIHNNKQIFKNDYEKEIERFVGIETYSIPKISGIGGNYKCHYRDFVVKEITSKGHVLEIKGDSAPIKFLKTSKDKFTTFNLIKINRDTFEALRLIRDALKIPIDIIEYSGLKDKCSISVQRISIKGDYVDKLKKLRIRDIFIRNIIPTKKSIKLGSNRGNQFIITIRNIEERKNTIKKIERLFKTLSNQGFINYYGLQRFGTFRPNSHIMGRFILEGKFKEAYNEFVLRPYSTESHQSQLIRKELKKTGDLEKAYISFPNSLNYEKTLIKYLINNPNDYEGAIYTLPDYLIKLLISSFQSYLFNKAISLRIKKGVPLLKPMKGDVISILDDTNGQITQIIYQFGGFYDRFLKHAIRLNRAVVVIPLVGYDTNLDEFPLMSSIFKEIIIKEQLNEEIFGSRILMDYKFKGSFRPMIVIPVGLNILEYKQDELYQNKYKLKIEFSIPKGSYATMLLRELMK